MSTNLRYGHLVIIHASGMDDNENPVFGQLSATGFTQDRIFFQKTAVNLDQSNQERKPYPVTVCRNYGDFIFQIWPKLSYEAHKEYKDKLNQKNDIKFRLNKKKDLIQEQINYNRTDNLENNDQKAQLIRHKQIKELKEKKAKMQNIQEEHLQKCKKELMELSQRKESEIQANKNLLKDWYGKEVNYAEDIQIMHYNSESFLNGKLLCSQVFQGAYKFQLSKEYGIGMIFRIMPKYKLRQEGENVQFQDQILLYNASLDSYVNFSTRSPIWFDKPMDLSGKSKEKPPYPEPEFRNISTDSKRYEAFLSRYQDTTFKLFLHCKEDDMQKQQDMSRYIKGGDLVRLRHTELEGYLTADYCYEDKQSKQPEVYVRKYHGQYEEENLQTDSLWEVEINDFSQRGNMCIIDLDDQNASRSLKLRHFATGRLLMLNIAKQIPVLGPHIEEQPLSMRDDWEKLTTIEFQKTDICQGDLLDNDNTYGIKINGNFLATQGASQRYMLTSGGQTNAKMIKSDNLKEEFGMASNREVQQEIQTEGEDRTGYYKDQDNNFYNPLQDSDYNLSRFKMNTTEKYTERHSYQISKISDSQKSDILFFRSSINMLKYLTDIYKTRQAKNDDEDRTPNLLTMDVQKEIILILEKFVFFILPDLESEGVDAVEADGIPPMSRQKLMKDLKIIELLTDIIYYPFKNEIVQLKLLTKEEPQQLRILQLCYRLIKHIIREYRPNEVYASQWIDLLMSHSMQSDEENDLKAQETLTELIDNNRQILESRIKKSIIGEFLDLLMQQKHEKYVTLLKALVNCDGEAIQKNQNDITKLILEENEEYGYECKEKLLFKLHTKVTKQIFQNEYNEIKQKENTDILIEVYDRMILLSQFKEESQKREDQGKIYNYFVQMILLLSDLCLERNFTAITPLQSIYTFDQCMTIVRRDDLYDLPMRNAFIRLLTHLWIDVRLISLQLPDRIRVWKEMEENTKMIQTDNDTKKYFPLQNFVQSYLHNITQNRYQQAFGQSNWDKNTMTVSVLHLLKNMLNFGMYDNKHQLENLLKELLNLLHGTCDVTTPEELDYLEDPNRNSSNKGYPNHEINWIKLKNRRSRVFRYRSRYDPNNEDILQIITAKSQVCYILKIVYHFIQEANISQFLFRFKQGLQNGRHTKIKSEKKGQNVINPFESEADEEEGLQQYHKKGDDDDHADKGHDEDAAFGYEYLEDIIKLRFIDFEDLSERDYITILLDLLLYKNEPLVRNAIEILSLHFSQKTNLINRLKEIQLIEDISMQKDKKRIKSIKNDLQDLAEQIEEWYPECQKVDTLHHKKAIKTIQLLKELCKFCTVKIAKEIPEDEPMTKKGTDDGELSERQQTERDITRGHAFMYDEKAAATFQSLLYNLGCQEPCLEILRYHSSCQDSGGSKDSYQYQVVAQVYILLSKLAHSQPSIQEILTDHMEIYKKHLSIKQNLPSFLLIKELYYNNKELLYNVDVITKMVKGITMIINHESKNTYRRCYLLETMKCFIHYNTEVIAENQNIIMQELCNQQYKNVLILYSDEDQKEEIESEFYQYMNDIEEVKPEIQISCNLSYYASLIFILSQITKEHNTSTQSKCSSFYPLETISELISKFSCQWQIKKSLLLLYHHVYCDPEQDRDDEEMRLVNQITESLREDVKNITMLLTNRKNKDTGEQKINQKIFIKIIQHRGIISMRELVIDYVINALLPVIETTISGQMYYDKVIGAKYSWDTLMIKLYLDFYRIRRELVRLKCDQAQKIARMLEKIKNIPTLDFNKLKESVVNSFGKKSLKLLNSSNLCNQQMVQYQTMGPKSNLNVAVPFLKGKIHIMQALLTKIEDYSLFQIGVNDEFSSLAENITNIERNSEIAFNGQCTVYFNELALSIINILRMDKEQTIPCESQLILVKILRKLIENENKTELEDKTQEIYEWDDDDWMSYEKNVVDMQNKLADLDVVKIIIQTVSDNKNDKQLDELKMEVLHLGIALLIGGNEKVQGKFLEELENQRQNEFLIQMKKMIDKNFITVKKYMEYHNEWLQEQLLESVQRATIKKALETRQQPNKGDEKPKKAQFKRLMGGMKEVKKEQAGDEEQDNMHTTDYLTQNTYCQTNLILIFRFLQLLCEGHNKDWQNYLREQKQNGRVNGKTQNIIQSIGTIYALYIKFINFHCIDLGPAILDFLIESIQGPCIQNQTTLVNFKIVDQVMDFVTNFEMPIQYKKRGFVSDDGKQQVDNLVSQSTELVLCLIEGNDDRFMIKKIIKSVNFPFMKRKLANLYSDFIEKELKCDPFEDSWNKIKMALKDLTYFDQSKSEFNKAFTIFELIVMLEDYQKEKSDDPDFLISEMHDEETKDVKIALKFYNKFTKHIEINFNEKLVRVYFSLDPYTFYLTSNTEKILREQEYMETSAEKLRKFQELIPVIHDETIWMAYLHTQWIGTAITWLPNLQSMSLKLSMLINLVVFSTSEKKVEHNMSYFEWQSLWHYFDYTLVFLNIMGAIQILMSCLLLIIWIVINGPLILKKQWRAEVKNYNDTNLGPSLEIEDHSQLQSLTLQELRQVFKEKGPMDQIFENEDGETDFGNVLIKIEYYCQSFIFLLKDDVFVFSALFYLLFAVSGYFYEMMYAFQLMFGLVSVAQSITSSIVQLGLTAAFCAICVYNFSNFAFFFIDDTYWNPDIGDVGGERTCTSLMQCFWSTMNYGPRHDPAIGYHLVAQTYSNENKARYRFRLMYDLMYKVGIKIVILQIIFGIIIDTFADLRNQKNTVISDLKGRCYICSINRQKFERSADGFINHYRRDHRIWNYMFYIQKLQRKDTTEYNGIETFVQECISNEDLQWFPQNQALKLKSQVTNVDTDQSKSKIENMKNKMKDLLDKLSKIQAAAKKKAKEQGKKKVKKKWKKILGRVSIGQKLSKVGKGKFGFGGKK